MDRQIGGWLLVWFVMVDRWLICNLWLIYFLGGGEKGENGQLGGGGGGGGAGIDERKKVERERKNIRKVQGR